MFDSDVLSRGPTHHPQSVAIERAKPALAEIRGEKMQARVFRQLEQARVAVKVFLVVVFQEAHVRQLAIRQPEQAPRPMQGETQRVSTQNAIADVEADEREQLGGRRVEFVSRAVVAAPIEAEMGGNDAPPRHGRNVSHVG